MVQTVKLRHRQQQGGGGAAQGGEERGWREVCAVGNGDGIGEADSGLMLWY